MDALAALVSRLESVTSRLESVSSAKSTGGSAGSASTPAANGGGSHPAVAAFDRFLTDSLSPFMEASEKMGGLVKDQVCLFQCFMFL